MELGKVLFKFVTIDPECREPEKAKVCCDTDHQRGQTLHYHS
jgi:hypothetical protein